MALKSIQAMACGLTALVLAAGPLGAQSLFEQMPTAPDQQAPAGAAPAEAQSPAPTIPSPATTAAIPAPSMSVPSAGTSAVPQAKAITSQGADCGAIQATLVERKNLVAKANSASQSKQKMTPQQACALFGQLQANGTRGVKWIADNKEWCSIPDSFADGFKADHTRVAGIRTKVCGMVAQYEKMQSQARAQAENGGGGLLGGPGLSGSFKMPQGAL